MVAFMKKALLYLAATSWLLQASSGQQAACYHVYTFDAPEFSDVDGCYVRSEEFSALGQPIYTDDEGDVDSGSTIAIMGAYVSATNTCPSHQQAMLSQSCLRLVRVMLRKSFQGLIMCNDGCSTI